ncbi:hypothetical protein KA068_02585 [Candidatus Saccharibacteria bacterium]|jgi:hypothetical protein|nr:hypothetical protein [Candidatus Saccharibacteria bacterium]
MPKTQKNSNNRQTHEQLGKLVASIYESGYLDKKTMYKTSFLKGLVQGLGGAIGATVLVALLVWILSLFSQIPLLGRLTDTFRTTIESTQKIN